MMIPMVPVIARPAVVLPAREETSQGNILQGDPWHTERMRQHRRNILNKRPELHCELESLFPQLEIRAIVHKREMVENPKDFEDCLRFHFSVRGCEDEFGREEEFVYAERYATLNLMVGYDVFKKRVIDFFADFLEKEEMI